MSANNTNGINDQGVAAYAPLVPLITPTFQVIKSALSQHVTPSTSSIFSVDDDVDCEDAGHQSTTPAESAPKAGSQPEQNSRSPKTNTPGSKNSPSVNLNSSPDTDRCSRADHPGRDSNLAETIPVSKALPLIRNIKTVVVYIHAVMELYDFLKDTAKLLQGKKDAVRFAVDLEGVDLGKPPGSADILQIHNGANNKTYIIDLLTLQFSAFLMTAPGLTLTLKQVLESPNIPKYFHDVRNDSNALWFHYKISLEGTLDTQIMQNVVYTSRDENDCRYPKKDRIVGLSLCMEEERMLLTWEEQVEFNRNKQLFQRGDDWSVMRIRPMPERVIKYCTNDVKYLLRLVDRYDGLVRDEKQKRMYTLESERRIAESKMEEYEPRADTEEERKKRIRAPSWNYWRVNDRRHLLLEQQIGSRPVCQPDCTGFWEQTHVCTPGCACHATCLARQKKNSAWYDAQTLDVKIDWCRKVSEAHTAGCRFEWSDILLRDEENPSATDYMPPPAPPLDDKDWAEIEQPPSSPWEEEVEREDEREDHHSHHEELQQEDTQQEDLQQGEAHPDETEPDEVQQETIQHDNGKTQETEYHHPSSSPGPGNDRPSQSWNLLSFLSSPGPKSG